ncbi:MAG: hypothetical protein LBB86_05090 [Oscillospiraceae bacterium]|jgi:hypothetical protein|nr:hypothetical protein [Oscillospiraceae bacterium]
MPGEVRYEIIKLTTRINKCGMRAVELERENAALVAENAALREVNAKQAVEIAY